MMKRLTFHNSDGTFGVPGEDISKVSKTLYACIYKLKDYEDTGFNPDFLSALSDCCMDLMDVLRNMPESTERDQAMRIVKYIAEGSGKTLPEQYRLKTGKDR